MDYTKSGFDKFLSRITPTPGESISDDTSVNIEPSSSTVQNHGEYSSDNLYLNWDDGVVEIRDNGLVRVKINKEMGIQFFSPATVWDDIRITPGSFDRPGVADPDYVAYQPGGSGVTTYLPEFAKNDLASFTVQMPHSYKLGSDMHVHLHWTPGTRGNEENGATVGWKIDYTWANIDGTFSAMTTADLSDACDGTDHKHQQTLSVTISGTGKDISSMLICNVKRTDTGTDDTWASTTTGQLPLLLEVDLHYEIDTIGSNVSGTK